MSDCPVDCPAQFPVLSFFPASYAHASDSLMVNLQYRRLYESMNSQYLKLLSSQVNVHGTAGPTHLQPV